MRLYCEFAKNALQAGLAYRFNTLLQLFNQIIYIFIGVAIWRALFNGAAETASNSGMVTLQEMVTYTIISRGISVFINNNVIMTMDNKIKTGEIAIDLIKPMNLKAALFCGTIGNNIYLVIFQLVPLMIVAAVVFGIQLPNWQTLILFLIALINGLILYFLITYILGLIGFWYLSIWHFRRLLEDLVRLFSGSFIPLWFFPKSLLTISAFLPFQLIHFAPLSIFLGKSNGIETGWIILQQLFWISALLVLERAVWLKGVKKLVIQGG